MPEKSPSNYWHLSTFYFFYFVTLGAFLPYWTIYLADKGFSAKAIGQLMAIMMVTKIFSPFIWGKLSDITGKRLPIIRLGSILIAVCFINIYWAEGFWPIALVMLVFSFFWHAVLPQFETLSLSTLGTDTHLYSRIRLWGSVGFIVAVLLTGELLDFYEVGLLPALLLVSMVVLAGTSLFLPQPNETAKQATSEKISSVVFSKPVMVFFAMCFFMQFSHGPYYTFFSIHLQDLGYSKFAIGLLWSLGVIAEIGIFMLMPKILLRFSTRQILVTSLVLAAIRWYLLADFSQFLPVLLLAQCLHAATYASFHAAAINVINVTFVGQHAGQGQALYSSVSFGLSTVVGALVFGSVWDTMGSQISFLVASIAAFSGSLIGFFIYRDREVKH